MLQKSNVVRRKCPGLAGNYVTKMKEVNGELKTGSDRAKFLQKFQKTNMVKRFYGALVETQSADTKGVTKRLEEAKRGTPNMKVFLQMCMKTKDRKNGFGDFYRSY